MENAIIRFAEHADLPALVELCAQHAEYECNDYSASGKADCLGYHLFSENPTLYCLVVEDHAEIVGYATYMKQFATWECDFYLYMDCLFLKEECRGHGVGEKLMERVQDECRALNCTHIQWQTPDFNVRAIKFYNRIGAQPKPKERYSLTV